MRIFINDENKPIEIQITMEKGLEIVESMWSLRGTIGVLEEAIAALDNVGNEKYRIECSDNIKMTCRGAYKLAQTIQDQLEEYFLG